MTSRDTAFDVLRAYAIVHVVLSHAIPYFLPHLSPLAERAAWCVLSVNFGVPLFFVLSGYLITQQLARNEPVAWFYVRRLSKIYPTYLLLLLVAAVAGDLAGPKPAYFLGLQNLWGNELGPLAFSWSLAVEIQFYLIAPLIFRLLRHRRALLWVILYAVAASLAYTFLVARPLAVPVAESHSRAFAFYCHTLSNMSSLCLGGILYWMHRDGRKISHAMFWLLSGVAFLLATRYQFSKTLDLSGVSLDSTASNVFFSLNVMASPLAAFLLAYWLQANLKAGQWPGYEAFRLVARISYQWYLFHLLLIVHWPVARAGQTDRAGFLAFMLLSPGLAYVLTVFVEEPVMRLMRNKAAGLRSRPSPG